MKEIFFFTRHGKYGWLSNFYRASISIDGTIWPTSEHYYQAMKTRDPEEQAMIQDLATPKEAKYAGYHVTIRSDWEYVKEDIMLTALIAKFTQHEELGDKLVATGDAILHEDSPWDKYWGFVKGNGMNRLGVLIMELREGLKG